MQIPARRPADTRSAGQVPPLADYAIVAHVTRSGEAGCIRSGIVKQAPSVRPDLGTFKNESCILSQGHHEALDS